MSVTVARNTEATSEGSQGNLKPAPTVPASTILRRKASPLARRLASAKGLDLAHIAGSGPRGRIIKADIEKVSFVPAASVAMVSVAADVPRSAELVSPVAAGLAQAPFETIRLTGMRRTIARRLAESKQQSPHIYLTVDIQLDALLKLRAEINVSLEKRNVKLSVNDLLIKALALALKEVPDCNVSFGGDSMIRYDRVDISMAVAVPGGLITPIITAADSKGLALIAVEAKDLAIRARQGKLAPHEYQGGTASISNLGMFGIKQFTAVINPPQAMIMAIGSGEKRACVTEDVITIATIMSATGSFDHRAIDGATGAQLMATFKRIVENPLEMLT